MRVLLLFAAFVVSSYAHGKKIPATIISNGKSRNVTFVVKVGLLGGEPNFINLQHKIKYFDEAGKKQMLRPEDVDEVIFDYEGMHVRMISCVNNLEGGLSTSRKILLKLEMDGPLRLYRYYYNQSNPGMSGPGGTSTAGSTYRMENLIFQKRNGPLKRPKGLGWRKDMREYFSDCPDLATLIENKDLRRKEVEAVVTYYNQHCAGK